MRFEYTSCPIADAALVADQAASWLRGVQRGAMPMARTEGARKAKAHLARLLGVTLGEGGIWPRTGSTAKDRGMTAAGLVKVYEAEAFTLATEAQTQAEPRSNKAKAGGYSARGAEIADAKRGEEGDEAPGLPSEAQAASAPIALGTALLSKREERAIAKRYAADLETGTLYLADDARNIPMPGLAPACIEEAPEAGEAPAFPEDLIEQLGAYALAGKLAGARQVETDNADVAGKVEAALTREQEAKMSAMVREAQEAARQVWMGKLWEAGKLAKARGWTEALAQIAKAYRALEARSYGQDLTAKAIAAFKAARNQAQRLATV